MKVSVAIFAYNHERFIRQAIDSALMQQVDFDYEIVIGEDCSMDDTRAIVADYQKRFPRRICLLLSEKNLGGRKNLTRTLRNCQGEYVALLDGDDYWTSPYKLQKQVDFLDSHPECAICFHEVTVFDEDGSGGPRNYCRADQKKISTLEDLLSKNFIPTCSVMYRNGLVNELPDWYYAVPVGDWPFHILVAQHGNIGYIDEVMGAYRKHPGGVLSRLDRGELFLQDLEVLRQINAGLNFRYEDRIRAVVSARWGAFAAFLVEQEAERGSVEGAMSNVMAMFNEWSGDSVVPDAWKAQSLSRIYAHSFFASYRTHDIPMTRYCLVKMVRHDPSWLRNGGVWSLAAEAFLGQRVAAWLRRWARAAVPIAEKSARHLQTDRVRGTCRSPEESTDAIEG